MDELARSALGLADARQRKVSATFCDLLIFSPLMHRRPTLTIAANLNHVRVLVCAVTASFNAACRAAVVVAKDCIGDLPFKKLLSAALINAVLHDVAILIVHRLHAYLIAHYPILFSFVAFVGRKPEQKSITLPKIRRNIQR